MVEHTPREQTCRSLWRSPIEGHAGVRRITSEFARRDIIADCVGRDIVKNVFDGEVSRVFADHQALGCVYITDKGASRTTLKVLGGQIKLQDMRLEELKD